MTNWFSSFFDFSPWAAAGHPVVDLIGWGLVHTVWQGALVAGALALALRLLRRHTPAVRYAVSTAALVLLVGLPVATVAWTAGAPPAAPAAPPPAPTATEGAPLAVAPLPAAPVEPSHLQTVLATADAAARSAMPWLVALWACGVIVLTLRLGGGAWQVRRLRATSTPAPADDQATLDALAGAIGLQRAVSLRRSDRISTPMVLGWLRPVVLVPAGVLAGMPPAQVEALLLHELAHVRRHDVLVGWLQAAVETLLFFHPAAWWISRRIRREREACCDDLAAHRGADRLTVARALAALAERQPSVRSAPFAPAATDGPLLSRIRRLVQPSDPVNGWRARASMTLAGALLLALPLVLAACASSGTAGGPAADTSDDREVLIVEKDENDTRILVLDDDTLRMDEMPFSSAPRTLEGLRFAPDGDSVDVRVYRRSFTDSLDEAMRGILVLEDSTAITLRRLPGVSDSVLARLNRTMPSADSLAAWTRRAMPPQDSLDAWIRRAVPSQDSLDLWIRRYIRVPDSLGGIDYRFDGMVHRDSLRSDAREDWLRRLQEGRDRDRMERDRMERHLDRLQRDRERMQRDRGEVRRHYKDLLRQLRRMEDERTAPERLRERAERLRQQAERLEEQARKMDEEDGGDA